MIRRIHILLLLLFVSNVSYSQITEKTIMIPCEVKECNPKKGPTETVWSYQTEGDKNRPAILWYAGGDGHYTNVDYQPIQLMKGKFDIIMVATPIPIRANYATRGYPTNAYNKAVMYRMKQASEYYKKLLGKEIWLGGISSGGPRMIGALAGTEEDRPSDLYAGLVFASPYLAKVYQGVAEMNISTHKIKYRMNLPILIIQHSRDHKAAQHPILQERFRKQLAKRNDGITELKLLVEGNERITYEDCCHHRFEYNKPEVARVVSDFILKNTRLTMSRKVVK